MNDGEGNTIAGNGNAGIAVSAFSVTAANATFNPTKAAILGNSIYNNLQKTVPDTGLGIDLFTQVDESSPPNGTPDTFTNIGPTPNDILDSDLGPNNYINFPVFNSVEQNGTSATINYNLDATDSPTNEYRIEFFVNDQADTSGYGEGQTFLGAITATNGTDKQASITLPIGFSLAGKSISATTTSVDGTTSSGFGATSEFSAIRLASLEGSSVSTDDLAQTGQSMVQIFFRVSVILATSLSAIYVLSIRKAYHMS